MEDTNIINSLVISLFLAIFANSFLTLYMAYFDEQEAFCREIDTFYSAHGLEWEPIVKAVPMIACTPEEAEAQNEDLKAFAGKAIFIVEDRWRSQRTMMEARLLAHQRIFTQVYARNCEIRRIDKPIASAFLKACHSYGDASCRYRYGLFLKRRTGEKSGTHPDERGDEGSAGHLAPGALVAVSEFSSPRRWEKDGRRVSSYEWVRYASLPGVRVEGGMGKMLKHFITEVKPDDIMSYADMEWSDGSVYSNLGFEREEDKAAVLFRIDIRDWSRTPVRNPEDTVSNPYFRWYKNFGSAKYRLKLRVGK